MAELEEVKKSKNHVDLTLVESYCDIKSFQVVPLQKEIKQILEEPARSSALQMNN